ncbi:cell wall-active antibiotics response protein LiaF [Paenibacillus ehimensis]|uniref:Cell wall-active antibiotics response protein LiaF n=1 Tax=Paenibacillus ehimensis TaxID=79264 RepID=A0ABT8VJB7_9BACL|nr:cell wall-active antibiotics response protein LiaF [Paenibacillus ehimensis]MDO3681082.1 cell wall-active antibiotics response protein LiaF [Paenibacillus ehimensis]MEC0212451.1 cell wall-active antibiotics response protein LiaF [Paenibacillus ehimensis]
MNRKRNRNIALVLIGAGLFLLADNHLGFFTVLALFLLLLGVYKVRSGAERKGYIMMVIGLLLLAGGNFTLILAIILISLGFFYNKSRKIHRSEHHYRKQSVIDSIRWGREPWVLRNMSIWNVLGELQMDLTYAIHEQKETTIILQGVIADIDLIVPEDVGLSVTASVLFGQTSIGYDKEAGVLNKMVWQSPNYWTADRQVKLEISYIVADIDIKIV